MTTFMRAAASHDTRLPMTVAGGV